MAIAVESLVKPDELIMVSQYYDIVCLDRYLERPYRQIGLSPKLGAEYTRKTIASFPDLTHFWLVAAEDGTEITTMIPAEFSQVKEVRFGHDLHLFRYERRESQKRDSRFEQRRIIGE